jgi:hypothetical protein
MSADARARAFENIFQATSGIFDRLPIPREPQLMRYMSDVLQPAVEQAKPAAVAAYDAVLAGERLAGAGAEAAGDYATGLNTVGLLCDRMSILTIKYWKLKHHYGKPEAANELYRTQIREMIEALALARRGFSSINNKVTNRNVSATADSFTEAFYGLQTTNLLIWESQEVLYTRDIMVLPAKELRAYIDYFSKANLIRNAYMESGDALFWQMVGNANA